jgi:cytochrome P450
VAGALPQVVYGLIAQRRRAPVGSAPGQRAQADLLQALLESRDEDGSGMSDVALRDELMTLMVGWGLGAAGQGGWGLGAAVSVAALARRHVLGWRQGRSGPCRCAGAQLGCVARWRRASQLPPLQVAGQETSAILLGWTSALLAHHPEAQQRAYAEVQQVRQPAVHLASCPALHPRHGVECLA